MSRPRSPPVTPDLVLRAYAAGLFPMAENADDPGLFWLDPEMRGIFPLDALILSRSLRKVVASDRFSIDVDRDFDRVIDGCAVRGAESATWINATIRSIYRDLFDRGVVHTVEAYQGDELVGGLYGVAIGGAFFGESMFHHATDASKVCLVHLAARLVAGGFALLDAQFVTPHLATLGAIEVPRASYHAMLEEALLRPARFSDAIPPKACSGRMALDTLDRVTLSA